MIFRLPLTIVALSFNRLIGSVVIVGACGLCLINKRISRMRFPKQ